MSMPYARRALGGVTASKIPRRQPLDILNGPFLEQHELFCIESISTPEARLPGSSDMSKGIVLIR
jgi:hypothetical protein